jgi:hypothetical protein
MNDNRPIQVLGLLVATVAALVVVGAIWWWPLGYFNLWTKAGLTLLVPVFFLVLLCAVVFILLGKENVGCGWVLLLMAPVLLWLVVILAEWCWPPMPSADAKLTAMVAVWQNKLDTILKAREQFQRDKGDLIHRMREMGFRSSKDVQKSKAHRYVAEELLEVQTQITKLGALQAKHESAIEQIQSGLRRMARQRLLEKAGVADEEYNKLAETAGELERRLQSESDQSSAVTIELDLLLKETFGELHHVQESQNP